MYAKQPKKLMILNILDILRKYTDEDHRLSQKEIADILKSEYQMPADRKAVRRNLLNLELCVERQVTDYGTFLGFDTLTLCPFERDAIVPEELSIKERAQLNAYHRKVFETLSPYFNEEETAWLRKATAEI